MTEAAPGRPHPLLLASLMLAMVLAALDQSIVATALPVIAGEMKSLSHMTWMVTVFMLTSTISAPIYGKLSDLYGQRPLFFASIGLFVAASALCGLSTSFVELVVFRGLQGLGAGGLATLSQTAIARAVTPAERGRYQGLFSGAFAISSIAGPLIGGGITTAFGWPWIFLVNLPLGLASMVFALRWLPASPKVAKPRIDVAGALALCTAASALLLACNAELVAFVPHARWTFTGIFVVACVLLWAIERRAADPMISPALFRNRRFSIAVAATAAMAFAMMGSLVFMPLYFQLVLQQTPAQSGFMTLPQVLMTVLTSIIGGRISSRTQKFAQLLSLGVFLECVGLVLLTVFARLDLGPPAFVLAMGVLGAGMGIGMPNATVVVQNAVSPQVLGTATSTMSFLRSLGGSLGVAVSGAVMASALHAELANLPAGLRTTDLLEGGAQALSSLPAEARQHFVALYRVAIDASLITGGLVMFAAFLLTLQLGRNAAQPEAAAPAS